MPITKSAAKRARQNIKRRRRNIHIKSMVKAEVKALFKAVSENNTKAIKAKLSSATSKIDKAAKGGLIHKNKAARAKSNLAKAVSGARTSIKARPGATPKKAPNPTRNASTKSDPQTAADESDK